MFDCLNLKVHAQITKAILKLHLHFVYNYENNFWKSLFNLKILFLILKKNLHIFKILSISSIFRTKC